jgi:ATP-dependent RNA helicase RhlE
MRPLLALSNRFLDENFMKSFSELNLLATLHETLAEKDLVTPTEIQSRALPLLLTGRSIVGVSETGSGKTLAYVLPILHALKTLEIEGQAISEESQPRAAVIVPTRELGEQVSRVFKPFTHTTRLRVRTVLGGTDFDVAKRNAGGAFEILVATPGRLVQMLDRGLLSLRDVRILVFDEADQMLDQGFLPDANRIASECLPNRQLALFSATVSSTVQKLMNKLFSDAEVIRTQGSSRLVPTLTTMNRNVENGKRFPLLESILAKPVKGGTLIFTNTREQCDNLAELLRAKDLACLVYRGEMDKVERRSNLKAFREGRVGLLISTDLAARGLDVEHVGRVINYHLPKDMDNYLHRVGRTARAGRKGLVINLVTERDGALMAKFGSVKAK